MSPDADPDLGSILAPVALTASSVEGAFLRAGDGLDGGALAPGRVFLGC